MAIGLPVFCPGKAKALLCLVPNMPDFSRTIGGISFELTGAFRTLETAR
jgi:hypothetical protein